MTAPVDRFRDPGTGRFIAQPPPWFHGRTAYLARNLWLLNRLYDVPPPSSSELLGRRSTVATAAWSTRLAMLTGDGDRETNELPYIQIDWPHFGKDFREYEHTVDRVGCELFGDVLRAVGPSALWARPILKFVVPARDIGSDSTTARQHSVG